MIDFPNDPRGRELQLLVERLKYERWVVQETDALIVREFERVVGELTSPKYRDLTAAQRQRTEALARSLAGHFRDVYSHVADFQATELTHYGLFEGQLARETARQLLVDAGAKTASRVGAFLPRGFLTAVAKMPIQGLNIGEWFDTQARTMSIETKRIIQQGLVDGKNPNQIATRLVAPDKADGPVLLRRARQEARAITRTVVNAVQNDAQFQSLSSLPSSVSDSYVYESVLDKRTTVICRALSGNVYRYDDPKRQVPPKHINCRSTVRALLKGIDETIEVQGQPRTVKNYDTWLRTQSAEKQNDILGATRARWWREGRMTLADAIDSDNRILTLDQLRQRLGIEAAA